VATSNGIRIFGGSQDSLEIQDGVSYIPQTKKERFYQKIQLTILGGGNFIGIAKWRVSRM
jgi:hypothetical protein